MHDRWSLRRAPQSPLCDMLHRLRVGMIGALIIIILFIVAGIACT